MSSYCTIPGETLLMLHDLKTKKTKKTSTVIIRIFFSVPTLIEKLDLVPTFVHQYEMPYTDVSDLAQTIMDFAKLDNCIFVCHIDNALYKRCEKEDTVNMKLADFI